MAWIVFMALKFYIFVAVCRFHDVHSKQILAVFPPVYSVISPLLPALELLKTKYGHETTIIMNEELAKKFTKHNVNIIISKNLNPFNFDAVIENIINSSLKGESLNGLRAAFGAFHEVCERMLSDEILYKKLHDMNFDLVITWKNPMGLCFNVIPYKLNKPFVVYGNGFDPLIDRIPFASSFLPNQVLQFSDRMSFRERLINTLVFTVQFFLPDMVTPANAVQIYAPNRPPISVTDLLRKAELHLMETDPLLDYSRPIFPHYVAVGGMGTKPANPLEGNLKNFLDSATHGAVIVSFGSLLKGFPETFIQQLLKAFTMFKNVKFVFRYGDSPELKENVYMLPWIPQNDLLGHANTKIFITHCGNAGQFESLYHGVPMIGIPVNGDQFYNAKRMESKGFGTILKHTEITVEKVVWHINHVLKSEEIQNNIKKASNIYKTRPESSKERASFWIDHVIKYGGEYMKPAHLDMPFYQYILLDVLFFILVLLIALCLLIRCCCGLLCRCVCKRKVKTE